MWLLLGLVALIACDGARSAPPVDFERTEVSIGGTPYALVASDVTGDGFVDLLAADDTGNRIVVLANDGRGGFAVAGEVPSGPSPGGLAAAEFDADGHPDLAVANHETDRITLLRGDGSGGFAPAPGSPLSLGVRPHVHSVATADLDEDGHADLVVDDREAEGLRLLFGRGDGTFEDAGTVGMGGDPYRGMAIADLDADGRLDLATPNEREVGLRLGLGNRDFADLSVIDVSPLAPFALAVGDVDGDGAADLGLGSGDDAEIALLLGDGTGVFTVAPGSPYEAGPGAKSMTAADLDGDGRDDLVVASWGSRDLTLLFGGSGSLRSHSVESGENPWVPLAADFDGDGRPDLAAANYGSGSVTVFLTRAR